MDFDFTVEQEMLRKSVAEFLKKECPFDMVKEIEMWGFKTVMVGNIKGFLNKYATMSMMIKEAEKRNLNIYECVGQTDGTKMNIEMALLVNGLGIELWKRGMEGFKIDHVKNILKANDFDKYSNGVVDYALEAEPKGGVFVVGYCENKLQQEYLKYYKMGEPPFYVFYRHYHICHIETPKAIFEAVINKKEILRPKVKLTDVYAFAKSDLLKGTELNIGMGGDYFYGMIDCCANSRDLVPILCLGNKDEKVKTTLVNSLKKDEPLQWSDIKQ